MKRYHFINIPSILSALVLLSVCACSSRYFIPKYFQEAQKAIDDAYCLDLHKACPKEYYETVALWEEAQRLYREGKYNEGIGMARQVKDKASKLCPPPMEQAEIVSPPKIEKPVSPAPEVFLTVEEKDSDGDGVYDSKDRCPDTPKGVKVDDMGCPLDGDGDAVPDYKDKCPGTPKCATVNKVGCWVVTSVNFDFDKWDIKPQYHRGLDEVIECIKKYPSIRIEIQGHTDNFGTEAYNKVLSEKRAKEVMKYFISKGVGKDRLAATGFGFSKPIASNETPEGRAINRRVELKPIY